MICFFFFNVSMSCRDDLFNKGSHKSHLCAFFYPHNSSFKTLPFNTVPLICLIIKWTDKKAVQLFKSEVADTKQLIFSVLNIFSPRYAMCCKQLCLIGRIIGGSHFFLWSHKLLVHCPKLLKLSRDILYGV